MKKRKRIERKGRMIRQTAALGVMAVVMLTGCTAQFSTAQFSAAQFSAAQFSTAQFSATQSSAVKFAAMHPGAVEPGAARYGAAQSGGAQSSAAQNADGSVREFSEEDYQKLAALQWDGYEDMSVSAYRNAVAELTDSKEYRDLLERFSASEAFYALKDSDELAAFCFYTLDPLTAQRYQKRSFGGCVMSDASADADRAVLEFDITLTIADAETLTVKEYQSARAGVMDGMQELLEGRQKEQLQEEIFMREEIDQRVELLTEEWGSSALSISVEYVYMPLCAYDGYRGYSEEDQEHGGYLEEDRESRRYPNGTKADYDSLFALMTPGYENLVLEDFNRELLAWANEDYERAERIGGDVGYHDFSVPLTQEEHFFVTVSANYSHMENAKRIQSHYTGREEEDPYVNQDLGYKDMEECGRGAYAGLWYQFSYHINDRSRITVGGRDRCIDGMISEIQGFWNEAEIKTLLTLEEDDMALILQQIADANSTGQLTLHIEAVSFEKNDERLENLDEQGNWNEQEGWDYYERLDSGEADEDGRENLTRDFLDAYDSLTAYRIDGYEDMSVAAFNALLAFDEDALQKAYEAYAKVVAGGISPSDENADFLNVTLNASLSELYGEKFSEPAFFPIYLSKKEDPYVDPIEGDVLYGFCFFANVYLEYHIQDPEMITVAERDRVLTAFREELQSYVEGLSREEIMETDMRAELERRAAELVRRYASYGMQISYEVVCEEFDL